MLQPFIPACYADRPKNLVRLITKKYHRFGVLANRSDETTHSIIIVSYLSYPEDAVLKRRHPSGSHHYLPFDLSDTH
jgi:hypothetical protein